MYMGEINAFFAEHTGERIVARFFIAPAGSSDALKGYYFNYVVPMVREGLRAKGDRKTEMQTEYYLRENSTVCIDEMVDVATGKYSHRVKDISELGNAQLVEHIEIVRQFAAEELSVFIDDPKTI